MGVAKVRGQVDRQTGGQGGQEDKGGGQDQGAGAGAGAGCEGEALKKNTLRLGRLAAMLPEP